MKEYMLKPITTAPTVSLTPNPDKPTVVRLIPPRQPLPTAVIDPSKPMLKLGFDVHLEFIVAVGSGDLILHIFNQRNGKCRREFKRGFLREFKRGQILE
jgi:hypothetical protein